MFSRTWLDDGLYLFASSLAAYQMKKSTINKDFEARQGNTGLDRSVNVEPPPPPSLGGTLVDWPPVAPGGGPFASQKEVGELRQAIALKVGLFYLFHFL